MRWMLLLAQAALQVALHEGAFSNVREVSLVLQCAREHGHTAKKQLSWLQKHSPRALGLKPDDVNMWSALIEPSCELPGNFFDPIWWQLRRRDTCGAVYHLAEAIVTGRLRDEPCDQVNGHGPQTWAAPRLRAKDLRQGMHQHACAGTLNFGWSW